MENYQFRGGRKSSKTIIRYLQENVPKYAKYNAAKSFFYAAIKKYKERAATPEFDPFRERRGENRRSPKRKNATIVTMVDEILSEDGNTASDVRDRLSAAGHEVSLSTIYRIAQDLCYRWQKPWYTDVLTPAQKLKRKLFCAQLLRLSERDLLAKIQDFMFTDEKWWDIVGPAMYKYVKADSKAEAKMKNQVCIFALLFFCFFFIYAHVCCCRCRGIKAKRVTSKREFIFGAASRGGEKLRA